MEESLHAPPSLLSGTLSVWQNTKNIIEQLRSDINFFFARSVIPQSEDCRGILKFDLFLLPGYVYEPAIGLMPEVRSEREKEGRKSHVSPYGTTVSDRSILL